MNMLKTLQKGLLKFVCYNKNDRITWNIIILDHDSGSFNSMDQNTHHILVKQ